MRKGKRTHVLRVVVVYDRPTMSRDAVAAAKGELEAHQWFYPNMGDEDKQGQPIFRPFRIGAVTTGERRS